MDRNAWDDLALAVIDRLKPQIDAKWVGGIELEIAGGEYAMAVQDLVGILADDQVEVTTEDRDEVRRLVIDLGEPTGDIDRLNVRGAGATMQIPEMAGQRITEVSGHGHLSLSTSEHWLVTIESDLIIDHHGARESFSGDDPATADVLRSLLTGMTIATVTAEPSGSLSIATSGEIRLTVPPHPDFEAWNIVGPGQKRIVSTPGGELAVWNSTDEIASSSRRTAEDATDD
jgi:hypothetical protein